MTAPDLRALAEAATPGPWQANVLGSEGYAVVGDTGRRFAGDRVRLGHIARCGHESWEIDKANAAYIAAASPDVILALLDEIDALRDVAETALQNTLTVMADDMRLRDADVILQRNTGSGRVPMGRALDGAPYDDDCDPDATPAPLGGAA